MKKLYILYGFIVALVLVLDRITKLWALYYCRAKVYVNSLLSCELTFNRGASWGILNDGTTVSFVFVTTIIVIITLFLAFYTYQRYKIGHTIGGELLVLSGSISNIIDRFVYGGVVDFIELSYKNFYWPSFNIADSAIVLGIALMVLSQVRE